MPWRGAGRGFGFRVIDHRPDVVHFGVWQFRQFDVFATIPSPIVVALVMRRSRWPAAMVTGGIGVYLLDGRSGAMTEHDETAGRPAPTGATGGGGNGTDGARSSAGRKRRLNPVVRKVLQILVSVVLLVAIFWYVFQQVADVSEVWAAIQTLTWGEVGVLILMTGFNLFTYWIVIVIATPGITYPQAAVLTQSTTAVANSVPAGGAIAVGLTYTILSSWGFSKVRATVSIVVTGIWNNWLKLATPVLALALLGMQGEPGGGQLLAALFALGGLVGAIVLFALILRSEHFAARVGEVTGRGQRHCSAWSGGPPCMVGTWPSSSSETG